MPVIKKGASFYHPLSSLLLNVRGYITYRLELNNVTKEVNEMCIIMVDFTLFIELLAFWMSLTFLFYRKVLGRHDIFSASVLKHCSVS